MGIANPQNDKMKSIALAIGGAIVAAAGTMFVPTALLESITGATGLSELVPATAAPLGDTARALIAFATGTVALIILLSLALRSKNPNSRVTAGQDAHMQERSGEETGERLEELKERFGNLRFPKMPWQHNDDDIIDLVDLPKLRSNDAHPDAPVRKPISALTDLGDANLDGLPSDYSATAPLPVPSPVASSQAAPQPLSNPVSETAPAPLAAQVKVADAPVKQPVAFEDIPVVKTSDIEAPTQDLSGLAATVASASQDHSEKTSPPSLAMMVAQMEAAVQQRKEQLAKLEKVASQILADKQNVQAAGETRQEIENTQVRQSPPSVPPVAMEDVRPVTRPPLEEVATPPVSKEDEEMDAALDAALATLQRMNRSG